jgi:glycosyltransferase involved in cell wall biosynthesis
MDKYRLRKMNDEKNIHMFVICAYQKSEYLEECIQSLKNQKTPSKIIAVTSTPNDFISNMTEKYNIPLFVNSMQQGISQDWNFALDKCRNAKYVTIAHQDDIYESDYSEGILNSLKGYKNPIIAFSDYSEIRDEKKNIDSKVVKVKRKMLIPLKWRRFAGNRFIRRTILGLGDAVCCPSVTYCMDNINLPLFSDNFKCNLDWDAWERLSRAKGSFVYVPKVLMQHRIHEQSATSLLIHDNIRRIEDYAMLKRFWPDWLAKIIIRSYSEAEKFNNSAELVKGEHSG